MAINIGASFLYKGKYFLDDRQNLPKTTNDLKNWSIPVPEGFEVYLSSENQWYEFRSSYSDEITGHFRKRNKDNEDKFDEIEENLSKFEQKVEDTFDSFFADKFEDLLLESNWIIDGENFCKPGIIVSVINDTADKNGAYKLTGSDYTNPDNWVKLLDRLDLITSEDIEYESNDTTIYTTKKVDEKFVRKDAEQTITKDWNFDNENTTFNKITAESSDIKDLPDHIFRNVKVGVDNILKNTSFCGEYDSAMLSEDSSFNMETQVYSQPTTYWEGVGTWEIVIDENSISGYSALLTEDSELIQTVDRNLVEGESYVLSYKSKGTITATIDDNTFKTTDEDYKTNGHRFVFSGSNPCIVKFTGEGNICEIKLEKGTVSTSWLPSVKDTDPVADTIFLFEFLKSSFKPFNNNVASGILLKEIIQVGKYLNNEVEFVKSGISGIYNNDKNIFLWSGGSFSEANKLAGKLENDSNYIPTDSELQNLAKLIITFGGKIFANEIIGNFRGNLKTKETGSRVEISGKDTNITLFNSDNVEALKISQDNTKSVNLWGKWISYDNTEKNGEVYVDSDNKLKIIPVILFNESKVKAVTGDILNSCKSDSSTPNKILYLVKSTKVNSSIINTGEEYLSCINYPDDENYYKSSCLNDKIAEVIPSDVLNYFEIKNKVISLKKDLIYYISGYYFTAGDTDGKAKIFQTKFEAAEDIGINLESSTGWDNIEGKPDWIDDGPFLQITGGNLTGDLTINSDLTISSTGISKTDGQADQVFTADGNISKLKTINGESLLGDGDLTAAATSNNFGLVKLGSDQEQKKAANIVSEADNRTYAIQKNSNGQLVVNVPWISGDGSSSSAVSWDDIQNKPENLNKSIISVYWNNSDKFVYDTLTSSGSEFPIKQASSTQLGLIKVGYTQTDKKYPIELDSNQKAFVEIPIDPISNEDIDNICTL